MAAGKISDFTVTEKPLRNLVRCHKMLQDVATQKCVTEDTFSCY